MATEPLRTSPGGVALEVKEAYAFCKNLAHAHYENFPVASFFLPRRIRTAVCVIYAFARSADDIADEGNRPAQERLDELLKYEHALHTIESLLTPKIPSARAPYSFIKRLNHFSAPQMPLFTALHDIIVQHTLPVSLFFDLLKAFKQDVIKKDYAHFDDVLDYCKYSANPVGRLLLLLTHNDTLENVQASDCICTALQLINFIQDVQADLLERHRCYIPISDREALGVEQQDLLSCNETKEIQALMELQCSRARALLLQGSILGTRLKGMFGFEIRLIISAANLILKQLKRRKHLYARPTLKSWHWLILLWQAVFYSVEESEFLKSESLK